MTAFRPTISVRCWLYHLNAEEGPEDCFYPKDPEFKKKFGPRGVIHSWAQDGDREQKIEDTGPPTFKRMETIDEEFLASAKQFIDGAAVGHDGG